MTTKTLGWPYLTLGKRQSRVTRQHHTTKSVGEVKCQPTHQANVIIQLARKRQLAVVGRYLPAPDQNGQLAHMYQLVGRCVDSVFFLLYMESLFV